MGPRATHQITGEQVAEHLKRGLPGQQRNGAQDGGNVADQVEPSPEIVEQYAPGSSDES